MWHVNTNEGFVKAQYLGPHRLAYGGRVIIHTHLIEWSQNRGASKLLTAFDFYGNGGKRDEVGTLYVRIKRARFQTNGFHFVCSDRRVRFAM